MGVDRFNGLWTLTLGNLILLLLMGVLAVQTPASVGVRIPVLRLHIPGQHPVCDGNWVFVTLLNDGSTKVNSRKVEFRNLSTEVGRIMETRAERAVYLVPDPGVPLDRFLQTFVALKNSAPQTHVGVLSGPLNDVLHRTTESPCDLIWPADELQPAQ